MAEDSGSTLLEDAAADVVQQSEVTDSQGISAIFSEIFYSPLNLALLAVTVFLAYKLFAPKREAPAPPPVVELPPMKKRDMTLKELRQYDGSSAESDGRICIAVNRKIFDVTKGKRFYGPGGPYHAFAGRDASRGLATFSVDAAKEDYDDLSDMNSFQMESIKEWEMQFTEKYHFVGRLVKPGEETMEYTDDEDTSQDQKDEDTKDQKEEERKETPAVDKKDK